jgi:hypothetical protein
MKKRDFSKLIPEPKTVVSKGHIKKATIMGEQQAIKIPPDHKFTRKIKNMDYNESIVNQLFWYWIKSIPENSVDSVWIQYNGVSRPVAIFRITSIKGCPL